MAGHVLHGFYKVTSPNCACCSIHTFGFGTCWGDPRLKKLNIATSLTRGPITFGSAMRSVSQFG